MDEMDMAQLLEVAERLQVNRSRAMSLAINFLHSLLRIECNVTEPKPRSYEEIVLPTSLLNTSSLKITEEPPVRKRRGWPKGKPRGPRKSNTPLLRLVEGRNL